MAYLGAEAGQGVYVPPFPDVATTVELVAARAIEPISPLKQRHGSEDRLAERTGADADRALELVGNWRAGDGAAERPPERREIAEADRHVDRHVDVLTGLQWQAQWKVHVRGARPLEKECPAPRSANLNSELMFVCRGQKALAAEVLASIAARESMSGRVIDRGRIVRRAALLGDSPLTQRLRFLFEMPIANLFDFLL